MKKITLLILSVFMTLMFSSVEAQALLPGGASATTGLVAELWLSTDKLQGDVALPADGTNMTEWVGREGKYTFAKYLAHNVPILRYSGMNFHPAVDFEGLPANTKLSSTTPFENTGTQYAQYTFWVSQMGANTSGTQNLFATNRAVSWNVFGWRSGNPGAYTVSGGENVVSAYLKDKYYGVLSTIHLNGGTRARYVTRDGVRTNNGAGNTTTLAATQIAVIGTNGGDTGEPFYGKVQEIIHLKAPAGTDIDLLDLKKIHSYLSLKYGTTLYGDIKVANVTYAGTDSYVNSTGIDIWTRTTNAGHENSIFGIGRDDAAGLYQKQSVSTESGQLTLFVGDKLEQLNSQNTGNIADMTHLVLGASAQGAVKLKSYGSTELGYKNKTLDEAFTVSTIGSHVWKAQLTGASSFTTNAKLSGSVVVAYAHVLVSKTNDFIASETMVYQANEEGIVSSIVIEDGDYVALAGIAEGPGGVGLDLRVWLRADDLASVTRTGDVVTGWNDQTSVQNNYTAAALQGTNKNSVIFKEPAVNLNYQPSLYFDRKAGLAVAGNAADPRPMSMNKPEDFTVFIIYNYEALPGSGYRYAVGFGGTSGSLRTSARPGIGALPGSGVGWTWVDGGIGGRQSPTNGYYTIGKTSMQMVHGHSNATNLAATAENYYIFDNAGHSSANVGAAYMLNGLAMASGGIIGSPGVADEAYSGLISEVIVYESALDKLDQDRVRTYLAIKYGITLDANPSSVTENHDYIIANGTKVWEGSTVAYSPYHNNIGGLMRDDKAKAFTNKARSTNTGGQLEASITGHKDFGQGTAALLPVDMSAIVWGNNSASGVVDLPLEVCSPAEQKSERIWLFSKTSNLGKQGITLHMANDNLMFPIAADKEAYVFVADTEEKIKTNNWDMSLPGSYDALTDKFVFHIDLVSDHQYIAFGYRTKPNQTCPSIHFDGVKALRFNDAAHRWDYPMKSIKANLGDNFIVDVAITESGLPSIDYAGHYPRHYYSSLRYEHWNLGTVTTTMTMSGATYASFEVLSIDSYINSVADVEIYGECDGVKVMPKLSYKDTPARSSYTITGNTAKAHKQYIGYYHKGSTLLVEFDVPVKKIVINNNATGKKALQYGGIDDVKFYTPAPLPVPVDGTIFVKSAPAEVTACAIVPIEWTISNYNCDTRVVSFSDLIKPGMSWVEGSVSVSGVEVDTEYLIAEYLGSQNVNITNIVVPSYGEVTIKAQVITDPDIVVGEFGSAGVITYNSVTGEGTIEVSSCDRELDDCAATVTKVIGVNNLKPVITTATTQEDYRIGSIVPLNITVHSVNDTDILSDLEIRINSEFTLIGAKVSSTTLDMDAATITVDANGGINITGLNIVKSVEPHVITMELQAPLTEEDLAVDEITGEVLPLTVEYLFRSTNGIECDDLALKNANNKILTPFKECIIYTYDIEIDTESGNRAFNEIRTVDTLEFTITKTAGDKAVNIDDLLTIKLPKYLELSAMTISSTDIPELEGEAIAKSNELIEIDGQTVRVIKFTLPGELINKTVDSGLNLAFTYNIAVAYKQVVGDQALIDVAEYSIIADIVSDNECEGKLITVGRGESAIALLTAKENALWNGVATEELELSIINPGFAGAWYTKNSDGSFTLIGSTADFKYTPAQSEDILFYVDAIFAGVSYGKVPVRVIAEANLEFTVLDIAAVCPGNVNLADYVTLGHPGASLEFFENAALTIPVDNPATAAVTTTREYYVRAKVGTEVSQYAKVVTVKVMKPTVIVTNLVKTLRVSHEGTLSLTVKATGEDLKYQWYKDGEEIVGATSANYTKLKALDVEDDGVYHVLVTGGCGILGSVETTVDVDPTLEFTAISHPSFECPTFSINLASLVSGQKAGVTIIYYTDAGATQVLADTNVSLDETTTYYVRASFEDKYSDLQEITISITPATVIVTQPKAENYVAYKGVIALSAEATGENLTYQWYKDDIAIDGANLSKYTQPSANPDHNGKYHVVVTGDCGTLESEKALVQVDPSLEFTVVQPDPICIGESINLADLVSGVAEGVTLTYYKDEAIVGNEITDLNVLVDATTTSYFVKAFDGRNDSPAQEIVITGIELPVITTDLSTDPINVSNGAAIQLSVTATGQNLTYQWYNGSETVINQTSNTLVILNATPEHNGLYRVIVTADCAVIESNMVDITVQPSIDFTVSNPEAICPEIEVDLADYVTGFDAGITIKYYADRAGVEELASRIVNPLVTTNYYVISSDGIISSPAQLIVVEVKTATVISANLKPEYRVSNLGTISLSVTAVGESLTYQWYKGGAEIAGETTNAYINANSTPTDDGVFHVVVTGECGIVESVKTTVSVDPSLDFTANNYGSAVCPATTIELKDQVSGVSAGVTVKYYSDPNATIELTSTSVAPTETTSYYIQASFAGVDPSPIQAIRIDVTPSTKIETQPVSINVSFEGAIVLRVDASGENLTYQWKKGGVDIVGETRATYEKLNATPDDNAAYTVIVTGECGIETSAEAIVKVEPTLEFTVTDSEAICIGDNVDLNTLITGIKGAQHGVTVEFFTDAAGLNPVAADIVSPTETTSYYAQATDGTIKSATQEVKVPVKPSVTITKAPTALALTVPEAIVLTVEAAGLNLTYQWYKDGVALDGETRTKLEVLNTTTAAAGMYKVIVSGDCNTAEAEAEVTIHASLNFTVESLGGDDAICPADPVDLTSLVSGFDPTISFKYYADRAGVEELASTTVNPLVTTKYYIIASNGSAFSPAQLIVVEAKTATVISANLKPEYRVSNLGTISLSVTAVGESLTYQWYKGGAEIAGATEHSYLKTDATPTDNATYHVVVTGECGVVESVKAVVSVDPSLEFTAVPYADEVCPETIIDLTAQVSGIATGVTVKYYSDPNATIELTSTSVAPTETTRYYVQASYIDEFSPIFPIKVTVVPSTKIETQPVSINVSFEGAIVLRVAATGHNLTYQWKKNGVDIAGETRDNYEKSAASPADNGVYTVTVTGTCGTLTSAEATVTVDPSLEFTVTNSDPICIDEPLDLNTLITGIKGAQDGVTVEFFTDAAGLNPVANELVSLKQTTTFHALATNGIIKSETQAVTVFVKPDVVIVTPVAAVEVVETEAIELSVVATGLNLTYEWYKDGVLIAGETESKLVVLNTVLADAGMYKVVVTGDCKTVESEANVVVKDQLSIRTTNPQAICAGVELDLNDYVRILNNPTGQATVKFYTDQAATQEVSAIVTPGITITYYAVATDGITVTEAQAIVVTVSDKATASLTTAVEIVCAGDDAELSIALTGVAPWTVVYSDGTTDYTLDNIADANHLFNVTVAKATTYTLKSVVDANGCTNTDLAESVSIAIHPDVVITEQPQALVFCLDNDFILTVKADNALSYQWFKDGVELAGETLNTLEVLSATVADMGTYHAEITGECETIESAKVKIDGNILDIIVQKWNNTLVANNNSATNGGYNFVSYVWYRDGVQIDEGPYHSVGDNPTNTLVMGAAYHVEVTTDDGRILVTCPYYPVMKDQLFVHVYPNPVRSGQGAYLEIKNGGEPIENGTIEIYTIVGRFVKTMPITEHITPLNLPLGTTMYVVNVKFDGYKGGIFKVVVE